MGAPRGQAHLRAAPAAAIMAFALILGGSRSLDLIRPSGSGVAATTSKSAQAVASAGTPKCHGQTATIVGTSGDDLIKGTSHADVIVGLGGNDVIYGYDGNDVICGGPGDDELMGL